MNPHQQYRHYTLADLTGATDPNKPYCFSCKAHTAFQVSHSTDITGAGTVGFNPLDHFDGAPDMNMSRTSISSSTTKHLCCSSCGDNMVKPAIYLDQKNALIDQHNYQVAKWSWCPKWLRNFYLERNSDGGFFYLVSALFLIAAIAGAFYAVLKLVDSDSYESQHETPVETWRRF